MNSFMLAVVVALAFTACTHVPKTDVEHVRQLTSAQALELSQRGGLVFLDVRSSGERLTGLVPSAKWILFGPPDATAWLQRKATPEEITTFVIAVRKTYPSLTTPIGVFCNIGSRSQEAARVLVQAGYAHVSTVIDGYKGNRLGTGLESELFSRPSSR